MTQGERYKIITNCLKKNKIEVCFKSLMFFERLSNEDLMNRKTRKQMVSELKEYNEYVLSGKMPYPEDIMMLLRKSLGLFEYDSSKDEEISNWSKNNVFNKICSLILVGDTGDSIRNIISGIYGVTLDG